MEGLNYWSPQGHNLQQPPPESLSNTNKHDFTSIEIFYIPKGHFFNPQHMKDIQTDVETNKNYPFNAFYPNNVLPTKVVDKHIQKEILSHISSVIHKHIHEKMKTNSAVSQHNNNKKKEISYATINTFRNDYETNVRLVTFFFPL